MHRFLIVIEKAEGNYSAYSPDLPGCIATGADREETERNMHEAIELHVRGLIEDNLPVPESTSFAEYQSPEGGKKTSPNIFQRIH
jgi:predicted RNase H-like HicB family nuclease